MKTKLSLLIALSLALPLQAISVKELLNQDAIPAISGVPGVRTLDLSNLNIDSLEGLQQIPGIETVRVLKLGYNNLTTIPANAFQGFTKLRVLGLVNNQIKTIDSNAFAGTGLKIIILNDNKLRDIKHNTFTDLSPWLISVGGNPLPKWAIKKIRKQAPLPAIILTVAPTKKNLAAAGAGVVVIALTVAAIKFGPGMYREHEARELVKRGNKAPTEQEGEELFDEARRKIGVGGIEKIQGQLDAEALALLKKAIATKAAADTELLERRRRKGDGERLNTQANALLEQAIERVGMQHLESIAKQKKLDLEIFQEQVPQ